MIDQGTPLCPTAIEQTLRNHILQFHQGKPVAHILLIGPSGSGKTTLVREAIQHVNITSHHINSINKKQSSCEEIDQIVWESRKSAPSIVFIDNIDLCNAQCTSIDNTLFLATLNELMETASASGNVLLIATACEAKTVDSSLVRFGRFECILEVDGLNFSERRLNALKWLSHYVETLSPSACDALAERIASLTPGFLFADLIHLFMKLETEITAARQNFPSENEDDKFQVIEETLPRVLDKIRLGLLKAKLPNFERDSKIRQHDIPLIGMNEAIKQLHDCLVATFRVTKSNINPKLLQAQTALDRIGNINGILIHGPTGCGKSALLKQAQNLLPTHTVNFLPIDTASILSSVIGDSERKLSAVFRTARAISPTVILIENIELLSPHRDQDTNDDGGGSSSSFSRILSTLLIEIDGIANKNLNKPIMILATTPSIESVDSALLRPGRFDTHIGVQLPDSNTRWLMLNSFIHVRDIKFENLQAIYPDLNKNEFSRKSASWTCADVISEGQRILFDYALKTKLESKQ